MVPCLSGIGNVNNFFEFKVLTHFNNLYLSKTRHFSLFLGCYNTMDGPLIHLIDIPKFHVRHLNAMLSN